ncbi:MAG TPA: response regulator transcription factor [Nitrospinota bacterium]|nr:response regulator transcription factor [Nitrospinota bacterium]
MIKVIIADDHRIVREGLKRILDETHDIKVIGEASTGIEAIQKIEANPPDVLILDISMPDMDGLDATKQIHETFPKLPILILTVHLPKQYALRLFRAGAKGYLVKDVASEELVKALRKLNAGKLYLSPEVSEELALQKIKSDADFSPVECLSDRELQILCFIASGKTTREIAASLNLSSKTIDTYRTRLFEKLNLRNNSELIKFALHHKLVDY